MGRNTRLYDSDEHRWLYDKTIVYCMQEAKAATYQEMWFASTARALKVFRKVGKDRVLLISSADDDSVIASALGQSTRDTRLYLCAHGNRDNFAGIGDPSTLAKLLKKQNLKAAKLIVLSACKCAEGDWAKRFHAELAKDPGPKIWCEVSAFRTGRTTHQGDMKTLMHLLGPDRDLSALAAQSPKDVGKTLVPNNPAKKPKIYVPLRDRDGFLKHSGHEAVYRWNGDKQTP